jgi:hypothetical protein
VLRLLGGIFTYAIAHGMRTDNPVRGVPQFRDGRRERRLSQSEFRALGKALRRVHNRAWPPLTQPYNSWHCLDGGAAKH